MNNITKSRIFYYLHLHATVASFVVMILFAAEFAAFYSLDKRALKTSEAAACIVDSKLVNSCRPWLGAAVGGYTMVGSDATSQFNFANKRLNDPSVLNNPSANVTLTNHLDIIHTYKTNASTSFSSVENTFMSQPDTYLLINYKPDTSGWASSGGGNATINARIDAMADSFLSKPQYKFFFALFHEPENDVSSGNCTANANGASAGSPTDYVNMWHNVRARFDAKGVNNVVWVMNYMGYSGWNCLVPLMWPGNSYVDWIMYDPYSGGNSSGASFSSSVGDFYDFMTSNSDATYNYLSKPWGLAEHGYHNSNGSTQANAITYWNQGASAIMNDTYPKLKAYVVFDTSVNGTSQVGLDFSNAVSTSEQSAYNSFANAIFAKEVSAPPSDTTKPTISITSPSNGQSISGTITLSVNASDNVGITKVETFWDGSNIIRSATAQNAYGWGSRWDTSNANDGAHTLSAVAYDAAGNTSISQITVNIQNTASVPAPIINNFSAVPPTLTSGSKSTLSWSTTNTTNCSVSPGGPQSSTVTSWQTLSLTTIGTQTYTLTCQNSVGASTSTTTNVTVNAPQTPPNSVVLSANSTSVSSGSSVTFSWTSSGSSSCTLNPGNYISSGTSSSKVVTNITSETTYKVTCQNSAGSTDSNVVTIKIAAINEPAPDPDITLFVADPINVSRGQTTTIRWASSNVSSGGCNLTPSPLTSTSSSGTWTSGALTNSTSYTLTCVNKDGKSISKSVSVTVDNEPAPVAPAPVTPTTPDASSGNSESSEIITTENGTRVTDAYLSERVTVGDLITLDKTIISDPDKVSQIEKVEYYVDGVLFATATSDPFVLDTQGIQPGDHEITQRTYFNDGSSAEVTQTVSMVLAATDEAAIDGTSDKNLWLLPLVVFLGAGLVGTGLVLLRKYRLLPNTFNWHHHIKALDPDLRAAGLHVSNTGTQAMSLPHPLERPPQQIEPGEVITPTEKAQ